MNDAVALEEDEKWQIFAEAVQACTLEPTVDEVKNEDWLRIPLLHMLPRISVRLTTLSSEVT